MREEAAKCKNCELWRTAERQLLVGDGPPDAKVMLIGEAPGRREEATGVPFVGESGQLLNNLMEQAGLKRRDVFVTNSVRCRPVNSRGENRKPTTKEINACRPHLVKEVAERNPELIITLGNEALKSTTGLSGITAYRGNVQKGKHVGDRMIYPTLHPAFALREPAHEKEIVQDIQTAVRSLVGGFREIDTPWRYAAVDAGPNQEAPLWSWDIETNAREKHDPELAVRFMAIDDGTDIWIYVGDAVQIAVNDMNKFIREGHWLVGHNASAFDRMVIKEKYGINLKTHDTQLLAHRIDEEQTLKLQDLAVRYLGVAPWKDGFDVNFWLRGAQNEKEWRDAITYCARDTRYDRLLFLELWALADDSDKNLYLSHNLPCSRALAQTERNGVYVSVDNARKAIAELDVDQRIELLALKNHTKPDFNPASYTQVRELLFSDLMLPIRKKIKDSEDASTDSEALLKLKLEGLEPEITSAVLKFREVGELLSISRDLLSRATKGYEDKSKYFHANLTSPFIYPSYSMTYTVNDRTSSFNPNAQNIPRDKRVRSIIASPPGYVLLEADYSQGELRMAAELSGSQSAIWREYQKPAPDVHMTMAMRLTGIVDPKQITKEQRDRAKQPNFAFLYHSDWQTYRRLALTEFGLIISEREARLAQDAAKEWGFQPWWDRVENEVADYGYITSIFGSKRRLPSFKAAGPERDKLRMPYVLHSGRKLYYYSQLKALRQAINFTDSSPFAHICQLALAQLVGRGLHTCGFVHDAIFALVRDDPDTIKQTVELVKYDMEVTTMNIVKELFGYEFSVPMIADVKVGAYWGDK